MCLGIFKNIRSFVNMVLNSIVKILLEIFVVNRKIRKVLKSNWCKFYIEKYVKDVVKTPIAPSFEDKKNPYTIWQYWEQGLESAPEIVRACVDSVKKFNPEINHVLLSADNVRDYVEIPEFIYDLKEKGVIKSAHFSDILRTNLLIQNGGCWIDATILMSSKLPEYIRNSEFFMFKTYADDELDGLNLASYFIHSRFNNKILFDTNRVIEKYWKNNNFLINYFMYLHALTRMSCATNENAQTWSAIPFYSFIPVQRLQYELLNKFDKTRWEQLKMTTSIHKLTHKFNILSKDAKIDLRGTFYEKIVDGSIND